MDEWQAVAVEGPEALARAFVAGFVAGRGHDPRDIVFADELDPDSESFVERVRDAFGRGTHQVAVVPRADGPALVAALAAGACPGLAGRELPLVREGAFGFTADTPSAVAAARIRATLLGELPAGIERAELREEGELDPENRGVHLYDTTHEFRYRAEGTFRGRLPEVALFRRHAAELDFVTVGRLVLSPHA